MNDLQRLDAMSARRTALLAALTIPYNLPVASELINTLLTSAGISCSVLSGAPVHAYLGAIIGEARGAGLIP